MILIAPTLAPLHNVEAPIVGLQQIPLTTDVVDTSKTETFFEFLTF